VLRLGCTLKKVSKLVNKTTINYVYYQVVSIDGIPRAYFRTVDGYKQPEYWDYRAQTWLPSDSFISYHAKGDPSLERLGHNPKQVSQKNEII